ncbi:MAG: MEDS domain-containing protein, partial [Halobacteriota archaeon]
MLQHHWFRRVKTTPTLPHFGLDVVDDVPWGTHLCLFYETKEDLIEILVPYFAEGLRSNEACMWVTSEPLEQDEAIAALAKAVPNIDNFIKSGQLLTLPYTEWHIKGGTFDPDRVTHGWIEKEQEALNRGFEGLRLAGNTAWIERSLSDTFTDYEAAVNDVITEHRMIAVCPYSVEKCTGNDVIDVIRNHVGTIIKQGGTWAVVEDVLHRKGIETALQQEREELAAMNEALQSTNEELRVSNEELRYETEQRKRAEEQLRATSHYARSLLEASLDPL